MNAVEQLFSEPDPERAKALLSQLTTALLELQESFEPAISHYRTEALYGRRIYVPAGVCVSTRVHKEDHLTVALTGTCLVMDEEGHRHEVVAPAVFVTPAGTQRACYAVTDTQWLTVHAAAVQDVTQAKEQLTCRDYDAYARWQADRLDYQQVLAEYGLTEPQARAISEHPHDQVSDPTLPGEVRPSPQQGQGFFVRRGFQPGERIGVARTSAGARTELGRFANHAVNPNTRFVADGSGGLEAVACQPITPGEEITVDYRQVRQAADRADQQLQEVT